MTKAQLNLYTQAVALRNIASDVVAGIEQGLMSPASMPPPKAARIKKEAALEAEMIRRQITGKLKK